MNLIRKDASHPTCWWLRVSLLKVNRSLIMVVYFTCVQSKESFVTYNTCNSGKVLMENNVASSVVGIGYVRLKLGVRAIRKLEKVRYVIDLKCNLISLGMLDE